MQLIPYIKSACLYIAAGVILTPPKRIVNVDLSYLPKCTEIFLLLISRVFKKKKVFQILELNRFLYRELANFSSTVS